MPPVVVHQQPHETRHLAPRCSCAYLCSWFALVVAILVPYFVAFHTSEPARPSTVRRLSIVARLIAARVRRRADNFWVKEKVWLQQPTVQFKHTALVMVEGATAGTAAHWSTEPSVNKLYGSCVPARRPAAVILPAAGRRRGARNSRGLGAAQEPTGGGGVVVRERRQPRRQGGQQLGDALRAARGGREGAPRLGDPALQLRAR